MKNNNVTLRNKYNKNIRKYKIKFLIIKYMCEGKKILSIVVRV